MTETVSFSCAIDTTDPACGLGLEIWLDDHCIFNQDHVTQSIAFQHQFSDQDAEHELRFVLKNKQASDTKIDADGNIVSDACLTVSDLAFDEIQPGHMITELATYSHDFNGTGAPTQERFYGTLGCNGSVSLKFNTPIYLWLLEHM